MTGPTLAATGVYTHAHNNLYLNAGRDALAQLADILSTPGEHLVSLARGDPQDDHQALGTIAVTVLPSDGGRLAIARHGDGMVWQGGARAMWLRAEDLRDLSTSPHRMHPNSVPTHVDLGYFDGSQMLEDSGYDLTVTLVSDGAYSGQ
jgi:hypothetical protein